MTKIDVVTGANSGIGEPLSVRLAKDGYDLIFLNRSRERSEALLAAVRRTRADVRAEVIETDLMDHSSIRRACARVAEAAPHVDVLVNNAGVLTRQRIVSAQGHDSHFQVNTLSPYLLMQTLEPQLAAAGGATVLNTGSSAMAGPFVGPLEIDALTRPYRMDIFGAYAQSKLALAIMGQEVAPALLHSGTIVRTACPGANRTTMTRVGDGMPRLLQLLVPLFFSPPDAGAKTLHHALFAPELDRQTGVYLEKRRVKPLPAKAHDPEVRARLMSLLRASAER